MGLVVDLYPHQRTAVDALSNGKILRGGMGSGKTLVAVTYYMENEAPKNVVVITTSKKRDSLDWEKDFVRYGVYKSEDATVAGVLTVDSWNNVMKYKDVRDTFFIFDEQRSVGSGAWAKAFVYIAKRNNWIMLSATPGDTWMDYISVFLANGFYKNRTEFKNEHVIYSKYTKFPKIDRFIGVTKLTQLRDQVLVDMPYDSHTTRITTDIPVEFDGELYTTVLNDRWNVYKDSPIMTTPELFYTLRKVANSDPSRLSAVRELMKKHDRLIIFYNFDYELRILRQLSDETIIGEWNGHRKQKIPDSKRWVYLVQYMSGAEGWNCVETNAMVFYSMTYSYRNWEQAHGRTDRLNTPFSDIYYYVLLSTSVIDKAVKKALDHKKNFNENQFLRVRLGR